MAGDVFGRDRRIAASVLAGLLAAFLCALVVAPPASATAVGHPGSHAAVIHKQGPAVSRADAPDVVITATTVEPVETGVVTTAPAAETDSSLTVDSPRTRGPPANDLR
jgi:hypothetical protein